MARPLRDGVDYFPLDVGMLRDKKVKLIKGEFGSNGILILIYLFCSIYEENGYFKNWTKDDCILVSEEIGCGCSSGSIAEVVKGCIRRSLFNEDMFTKFGILTSVGIQRRFIRAASQRDDIQIIKEYWLLNTEDKKDVPSSVFSKINFKNIKTNGNLDKTCLNSIKTSGNPQRKVKESKVKESNITPLPPTGEKEEVHKPEKTNTKQKNNEELTAIWDSHKDRFSKPMREKILEWIRYKKEKNKEYKPQGLNSLLSQIEKKVKLYSKSLVINIIDESMASNYQGILWDKLDRGVNKNNLGTFKEFSNTDAIDGFETEF